MNLCIKPRSLRLEHEYLRLPIQKPAITEMVLLRNSRCHHRR